MISKILVAVTTTAMLVAPALGFTDPTSDTISFGGINHKPGLKVRMTQSFSDLVQDNLLAYGVSYFNYDLDFHRQGTYKVR